MVKKIFIPTSDIELVYDVFMFALKHGFSGPPDGCYIQGWKKAKIIEELQEFLGKSHYFTIQVLSHEPIDGEKHLIDISRLKKNYFNDNQKEMTDFEEIKKWIIQNKSSVV